VLAGPTLDPRARSLPRTLWRWALESPLEFRMLPLLVRDYAAAGLPRTWHTLQLMLRDRIEEKLPRMWMPTLLVRGSRDAIAPQRWAEEAARLLPRGRLVVIPGTAHAVNFLAAGEFARVVDAFVRETRDVHELPTGQAAPVLPRGRAV
jgi:2-hydroxy-6-oxonona-2,4-dienedioate hydrolase